MSAKADAAARVAVEEYASQPIGKGRSMVAIITEEYAPAMEALEAAERLLRKAGYDFAAEDCRAALARVRGEE